MLQVMVVYFTDGKCLEVLTVARFDLDNYTSTAHFKTSNKIYVCFLPTYTRGPESKATTMYNLPVGGSILYRGDLLLSFAQCVVV